MNQAARIIIALCLACHLPAQGVVTAAEVNAQQSIADRGVDWPAWEQWVRVFSFADYNTRVVVIGTTLLGCAAGMVGSFALLRKRALMGDAISHATLPGICLAFMIVTMLGGDGKSLWILLIGATVTGLLGVATILLIRNTTRLKEDTALGAVLSVFFGAGIALMGIVQQMEGGHAAGLESFVYGKTASMGFRDTQLIGAAALVCISVCVLLFKELKLLCFDEDFAGSGGVPVIRLDLLLMALVTIVCIVGLQAVGLILMIALLVIPAAAARFWTETMWKMFLISGCLGAVSGLVGAAASALFSRLPSGAMIVMVCTAFFVVSMVFGTARGILIRYRRRRKLNRSVGRQHLLRAIYEIKEQSQRTGQADAENVSIQELLGKRSWSLRQLHHEIRRAESDELVEQVAGRCRLTDAGLAEASRLTRQHRLWELYLITYADVAPSMVDSGADAIEHVLDEQVITQLESLLDVAHPQIPASPHELSTGLQGGS